MDDWFMVFKLASPRLFYLYAIMNKQFDLECKPRELGGDLICTCFKEELLDKLMAALNFTGTELFRHVGQVNRSSKDDYDDGDTGMGERKA